MLLYIIYYIFLARLISFSLPSQMQFRFTLFFPSLSPTSQSLLPPFPTRFSLLPHPSSAFPHYSVTLTSCGLSQSISSDCPILPSDKFVCHPLFSSSIFLVLIVLSSSSSQRVSRRPHWCRTDWGAPPLYPWHVFSTIGPTRKGEHGQSGPHGRPALSIHRQHSQGPTLAWPRPTRGDRHAWPSHWPGEVQCCCLPATPVLWKWQDQEGCASAEGNSCSGGSSGPPQVWSPSQGLWCSAQHLLWQGQWQQGGHQELRRHPSPRSLAEKDQWHGGSRTHHW